MVITVDGPSGAGKSSVSRRLAAGLKFAFLDTGALYRGVALGARWAGVVDEGEAVIAAWLTRLDLEARPTDGRFLVLLEGRDVEPFIRNEEMAALASRFSALGAVRAHLLTLQRRAGQAGDLVAEGRDMGTVVFPEAEMKFFLTADPAERARRRWLELKPSRPELSLDEVAADMIARDERDSRRALAPLKPAADALVVDTTALSEEQVLALMLGQARECLDRGQSG
jgi:cytidylate kinase